MSKADRLFQLIHSSFHPLTDSLDWDFLFISLTLIRFTHEIAILNVANSNIELTPLQSIINYSFNINTFNNEELLLLLVTLFVINICVIGIFSVAMVISTNSLTLALQIIQICYCKLLIIPNLYVNVKILYYPSIASSQNQIAYSLLSCINIIISQLINWLHCYFGRSDQLIDENVLLSHNHNIFVEILKRALIDLSVILFVMNQGDLYDYISFGLLGSNWIMTYVSGVGCIKYNSRIECAGILVSAVVALCLKFKSGIFLFLMLLSLLVALHLQIETRIIGRNMTNKNQVNLDTIQLAEYSEQFLQSPYYSLIRAIINKNHICQKCKFSNKISLCLLKQLIKSSSNQVCLFYCYYISVNTKFKCLIYLINLNKNNSYYYKLATRYLIMRLLHELKIQQDQFQIENQSTQDQQICLDIPTYTGSYYIGQTIFPQLNKTISAIIYFWNSLIKGQTNIAGYLSQLEIVGKAMIDLRNLLEQHINMDRYHLLNRNYQDVLTLRILQIYYSAIYLSQYHSRNIDRTIEELLKQDRFKQEALITNIQLENNQVLILSMSLVFNRGDLINANPKRIARYLNVDESRLAQAKSIHALMPQFISAIHSQIVDAYIVRGTSSFTFSPAYTYLKNLNGFLELTQFHLVNSLSRVDDISISGIISRVDKNNKFVLFGVDGKILGFDEWSFELLKSSNDESIKQPIVLQEIIDSGLISYYCPEIAKHVAELVQMIQNQQVYYISDIKGTWSFPGQHQELLYQTQYLFNQFQPHIKTMYSRSSVKTFRDIVVENHSEKKVVFNYNGPEFEEFRMDDLLVNDNLIIMLHPEYLEYLQLHQSTIRQNKENHIKYSLEYRQHLSAKNAVGYFQLTFTDISVKQSRSLKADEHAVSQVGDDFPEENLNYVSDVHIQSTQKYAFLQAVPEASSQPSSPYSQDVDQELITNRILGENQDMISYNKNSDSQKDSGYKISLEEMGVADSNFTKKQNKKKHKKLQNNGYEASVQQSVSSSGTSKDTLTIIKQLKFRGFVSYQKLIIAILIIILIIMITTIFLNVDTIDTNLNQQLAQVDVITNPKELLFIYTAMYFMNLNQYLISHFNYSQGLLHKFDYFQAFTKAYAEGVLPGYQIQVFNSANQYSLNRLNATYIINAKPIDQIINVDDLFNNIYQQLLLKYQMKQYDQIVLPTSFARQNLLQTIQLNDKIFDLIEADSVYFQNQILNQFVYYIVIEILLICLLFLIQYHLYHKMDQIKKQIIYLVTRISENQAFEHIQRLECLEEIILDETSTQWKHYDFSEFIFEQFSKEPDGNSQYVQSHQKKSKQPTKITNSSLYAKITNDYYRDLHHLIIFAGVIVLWLTFILSGYVVYNNKLTNIEPSLNLTFSFIDLKKNLNNAGVLAMIIKTDILIQQPVSSLINQTAIINELQNQIQSLSPLMTSIFQAILKLAQSESAYSAFSNILSSDLCTYYSDFMQMCSVANQSQFYPTDFYIDLVNQGIVTYIRSFQSYVQQEFIYEFANGKYMPNFDKSTLSYNFQNYITQYMVDIQGVVYAFQLIVYSTNSSIMNSFRDFIWNFYIGVGIPVILIIMLIQIYWIYQCHLKMQLIRQSLALIPNQVIQLSNMKQQIQSIHDSLY